MTYNTRDLDDTIPGIVNLSSDIRTPTLNSTGVRLIPHTYRSFDLFVCRNTSMEDLSRLCFIFTFRGIIMNAIFLIFHVSLFARLPS